MTLASEGGPRLLVRDVLSRDGSTLRLQAPADFGDIKAFYDGLSPESRYSRFHDYGRTDAASRAAAEAGGVDRLALIGRYDGRVVAVASYDELREPGVAGVSFAVADDLQQHGIGTRMLEQPAAVAAEPRIHRFDAEVMPDNQPMLGVFGYVGFAVRRRTSFGELTVSLDITPTEAVRERIRWPPGTRGNLARQADRCVGAGMPDIPARRLIRRTSHLNHPQGGEQSLAR